MSEFNLFEIAYSLFGFGGFIVILIVAILGVSYEINKMNKKK
tara:strand:- start:268 stop:393 length:126 start_codon:yes stop_codon:yes gene_type:complete